MGWSSIGVIRLLLFNDFLLKDTILAYLLGIHTYIFICICRICLHVACFLLHSCISALLFYRVLAQFLLAHQIIACLRTISSSFCTFTSNFIKDFRICFVAYLIHTYIFAIALNCFMNTYILSYISHIRSVCLYILCYICLHFTCIM